MSYKLFLDDEAGKVGMAAFRNPPVGETDWKVAHSTDEARSLVEAFGMPSFMSFDHDLGGDDTAMRFLKWLSNEFPEGIREIGDYQVHSRNPVGAENIKSYMESWRRSLE